MKPKKKSLVSQSHSAQSQLFHSCQLTQLLEHGHPEYLAHPQHRTHALHPLAQCLLSSFTPILCPSPSPLAHSSLSALPLPCPPTPDPHAQHHLPPHDALSTTTSSSQHHPPPVASSHTPTRQEDYSMPTTPNNPQSQDPSSPLSPSKRVSAVEFARSIRECRALQAEAEHSGYFQTPGLPVFLVETSWLETVFAAAQLLSSAESSANIRIDKTANTTLTPEPLSSSAASQSVHQSSCLIPESSTRVASTPQSPSSQSSVDSLLPNASSRLAHTVATPTLLPKLDNLVHIQFLDYVDTSAEYQHYNYALTKPIEEFSLLSFNAWQVLHNCFGGFELRRYVSLQRQPELAYRTLGVLVTGEQVVFHRHLRIQVSLLESVSAIVRRLKRLCIAYRLTPPTVLKWDWRLSILRRKQGSPTTPNPIPASLQPCLQQDSMPGSADEPIALEEAIHYFQHQNISRIRIPLDSPSAASPSPPSLLPPFESRLCDNHAALIELPLSESTFVFLNISRTNIEQSQKEPLESSTAKSKLLESSTSKSNSAPPNTIHSDSINPNNLLCREADPLPLDLPRCFKCQEPSITFPCVCREARFCSVSCRKQHTEHAQECQKILKELAVKKKLYETFGEAEQPNSSAAVQNSQHLPSALTNKPQHPPSIATNEPISKPSEQSHVANQSPLKQPPNSDSRPLAPPSPANPLQSPTSLNGLNPENFSKKAVRTNTRQAIPNAENNIGKQPTSKSSACLVPRRSQCQALGSVSGLQNIGNTCYMNAALQVLLGCAPIVSSILSKDFIAHLNLRNSLGSGGQVVCAFAEFLHTYVKHNPVNPSRLFSVLSTYQGTSPFRRLEQCDSQELLSYLLDKLHEDLNQVKHKPYREEAIHELASEQAIAEDSWSYYLSRNKSIVSESLAGQFRSEIRCPDCNKVSITFDPFLLVTLQFPTIQPILTLSGYFIKEEGEILKVEAKAPENMKAEHWLQAYFGRPTVAVWQFERKIKAEWIPSKSVGQNQYERSTLFFYPCLAKPCIDITLSIVSPTDFNSSKNFARKVYTAQVDSQEDLLRQIALSLKHPLSKALGQQLDTQAYLGLISARHILRLQKYSHDLFFPLQPSEAVTVTVSYHNLPAEPKFNHCSPHNLVQSTYCPPKPKALLTIRDMFDSFSEAQLLTKENMWYCPCCKEHKPATKLMRLHRLPEYLFLHLKRFGGRQKYFEKINTPLHLNEVEVINGMHYELLGVVNHCGGLHNGHYTAHAKRNSAWYYFNDQKVSLGRLSGEFAYILLYRFLK